MIETERERSMPLCLLMSMILHALLFLIGPTLVAGLFPSFKPGDQGGMTFVTLVDVPMTERVMAAVAEAARRPESRPEPTQRPEPRPQAQETPVTAPTTTPTPVAQPQPVQVAEVTAERVAPRPADDRPQAVATTPVTRPAPEPVAAPARPEAPTTPTQVQPRPAESTQPSPTPVLTADRGENVVAVASQPATQVEVAASAATTTAAPGPPARAETPPQEAAAGTAAPSGTGARQDIPSAAPEAVIAPEPRLPPTGTSMVASFGGAIFPKDAVGLLRGTVTVEVAAIVGPDGAIVDAVLIDSSGIAVVDVNAMNIATRLIRYRPHDEMYELRVFITYRGEEQELVYRTGEFIRVPPSVGRFGSGSN